MTQKEILYSREKSVAVIALNRPERMNPLTLANHDELARAIDQAYNDDEVRVIVLTGAGIRRGLGWPLEECMRYHALASPFCSETEDHKEGALAFLEKRKPVFKGK